MIYGKILNSVSLGFVLFLILGCGQEQTPVNKILSDPVELTQESKEDQRRKIVEDSINDISRNNPSAAKIAQALRCTLYLAEPVSYPEKDFLTIRALEKVGDCKSIAVYPVLPGDEEVGPDWEFEIMSTQGPVFHPEFPLLILGSEKISHFWNGLAMLRQGSRVLSFTGGVFDSIKDPVSKEAVNEYCAYTLVFEVLIKEGGERYKKIIRDKASIIKAKFVNEGKGKYSLLDSEDVRDLDEIFGVPLSDSEEHIRWQTFCLHAIFMAIDELNKDRKTREEAKIDYLRSVLAEED